MGSSGDTQLTVDRHLSGDDRAVSLRADALAGLSRERKGMPPKWFYDAEGSRLFDEVTRLPVAS